MRPLGFNPEDFLFRTNAPALFEGTPYVTLSQKGAGETLILKVPLFQKGDTRRQSTPGYTTTSNFNLVCNARTSWRPECGWWIGNFSSTVTVVQLL